jgi:NAD(P)-dependent dehydrogenase (short-subunit alcohol dehydrogenase family)
LVTGAGQGIGKAFAVAWGEAGAKVAIADLRTEVAEQVSLELQERQIESLSVTADVADPTSVEAMVAKVSLTSPRDAERPRDTMTSAPNHWKQCDFVPTTRQLDLGRTEKATARLSPKNSVHVEASQLATK